MRNWRSSFGRRAAARAVAVNPRHVPGRGQVHHQRKCPGRFLGRDDPLKPFDYLTSTVAPAASSEALALSASALETFSSTGLGAPSTRSFASFRPRLVSARTSLITWIFLSPPEVKMTS